MTFDGRVRSVANMMRLIDARDSGFEVWLKEAEQGSSLFDTVIESRTREVVNAVAERGDDALCELTRKFDKAELRPDQLALTIPEFMRAALVADKSLREAVRTSAGNIERFSRKSLRRGWSSRNGQGGKVGEKFDAFRRVGIYIPGGTAPLVSTALMTIVLAKVAGCREIVVCTPCDAAGQVNPALLFAVKKAGATEVYRLGGAQAIAAMALGTATIRRVDKVFGPGNAYVVAAKRLLFGHVSVDLLPGPSEVLVLADSKANPAFIAADLLAQAEHGSGHERAWLVTPSSKLVEAVRKEMARQLPNLSRRQYIEAALARNGWAILVESMSQGVEVANRLAPEHCEIHAQKAESLSKGIVSAGAIFLGGYSPTVLGDYVAGPSHTLPTGGAGRSFAGLTVDQFQRRTSVVEYGLPAVRKSAAAVAAFAAMEGLDAHGQSLTIRLGTRSGTVKTSKRSRN